MRSSIKIMLKKSKGNSDSELPLYLRIIKDRESALISLGISVKAEHWNSKKQLIKKSKDTPLAQKWNETLMRKREEVRLRIFELEEENSGIRARELKDLLSRPEGKYFLEQVRSESQKALRNREISQWEKIDLLEKHLAVYRNSKDIMSEDLDPDSCAASGISDRSQTHDWKAQSSLQDDGGIQSKVDSDDTLRSDDPLRPELMHSEYIRTVERCWTGQTDFGAKPCQF